ncbi:hypothetical protein GGI15_002255 [Coemansia interrupta]|uniref:SHSP domain-containing protein n=1 Tax=Coemansia interrupta TaxID=1126814 RepID=A0A9W8HDZ2_9FUNG|nr:hypothetical protein GGI15_002255 [Coemansia interrupta]
MLTLLRYFYDNRAMDKLYKQGETKSVSSLRHEGIVVVNMAPYTETRHVLNGHIVDPQSATCQHIDDSDWNPFYQLETPTFFHTFVSESPEAYTLTVTLPSYITRYIRVQRHNRVLAVVGKAMARRQWTDAKEGENVHELWRVYWRLFHLPMQCDVRGVRAWYDAEGMRVVVPRRQGSVFRAVNWVEERLWTRRARTVSVI